MVAQCVLMPCPSCSHDLRIRVGDLGREGGCKICGHRFRAGTQLATAPEVEAAKLRPGNQMLRPELQRTRALMITKQASIVEQLIAELGDQFIQPRTRAKKLLALPLHPAVGPDRAPDSRHPRGEGTARSGLDHPSAGGPAQTDRIDYRASPDVPPEANSVAGMRLEPFYLCTQAFVSPSTPDPRVEEDSLPFSGATHVVRSGTAGAPSMVDMEAWIDRLAFQRDEARAECARLREEIGILRSDLSGHASQLTQLRPLAEQLKAVLASLERLNAERDMLLRETARLRTRVVELQVARVQIEVERHASDRIHLAEIDRLAEALDDAESALARNATQHAPTRTLPPQLARLRRERAPSLQPHSSGGPPD